MQYERGFVAALPNPKALGKDRETGHFQAHAKHGPRVEAPNTTTKPVRPDAERSPQSQKLDMIRKSNSKKKNPRWRLETAFYGQPEESVFNFNETLSILHCPREC